MKKKLDFTGVETFTKVSEGTHRVKIKSCEETTSQGGNDMMLIAFEVVKGEDKGGKVFESFPLTDTALWKLKGLLEAIGKKADGRIVIDFDSIVGKELIIDITHESYEGKQKAKVADMRRIVATAKEDDEEEEEEEEEEEKPVKKTTKKAKKPAKPEPEEVEEEDDEEDEEDDEEEEEKPVKKAKKIEKKPAKKIEKKPAKKAKDEDEDEDDDDDWEDEE